MTTPGNPSITTEYDPFGHEVLSDPYPFYDVLREESPVHWVESRATWVLFRYDDVQMAARNPKQFSSERLGTYREFPNPLDPGLLGVDPPEHTRIRRHGASAFSNKRIEALYDDARSTVASIMDNLDGRERIDLVTELAEPYVADFAGRAIGLPPAAREQAPRWAEMCSDFLGPDTERYEELRKVWYEEIPAFFGSNTEWEPDSIFTELMAAGSASNDVEMDEIFAMFGNIVGAGFDTGINAAGHAALVFAADDEEWQKVRGNRALVGNVLEESLRWDSPAQVFFRRATEDVTLHGATISAGDKVGLCWGSANRDPRRWGERAEVFDVTRDTRGHLGFGWGPHRCIGSPLARLESKALWDELCDRVECFEVVEEPTRRFNTIIRGFSSIPMRLHWA